MNQLDAAYRAVQLGIGKPEGPDPRRETSCSSCFHRTEEGFCACRDISEMVLRNCPDWTIR